MDWDTLRFLSSSRTACEDASRRLRAVRRDRSHQHAGVDLEQVAAFDEQQCINRDVRVQNLGRGFLLA